MRAVLAGVVAALMVAATGGDADGRQPEKIDAKLLVGKWEPTGKKEDFILEFTADGKASVVGRGGRQFKAEGTYKLDGDKLKLKMKVGEFEKTQTRTILSLTKTELVSSDEGGIKDTLVRVMAK